ncbi:MAG: ThiF family adenylyltransferase [Acidimicrobiales bacterium]|nr:ThiF family adenylyltransferase [Acidimicrobiales bacterium]
MRSTYYCKLTTLRQRGDRLAEIPDLRGRVTDRAIRAEPHAVLPRLFVVDRVGDGFELTPDVAANLRRTVGGLPVETGGLIGGSRLTGTVSKFWFDDGASASSITYDGDPTRHGPVLKAWNAAGDSWLGLVHSHPRNFSRLSSPDLDIVRRNLEVNRGMRGRFVAPIAHSEADGGYELHSFLVRLVAGAPTPRPMHLPVVQHRFRPVAIQDELFARIRTAVDLELLASTRVVIVGCGGAAALAELLVRQGVGEIVLIDPDVVSPSNVATQMSGRSTHDLGRPKVLTTAERLLDLGTDTRIVAVHASLDDLDDVEIGWLLHERLDGNSPRVSLLVGATDNFLAQARVARLGLHHSVGTLVAGAFPGGVGFQLAHAFPSVSHACIRCALGPVYRHQLANADGPVDGRSEGSCLAVSPIMEGTTLMVLLAMAHRADPTPSETHVGARRWRDTYDTLGVRNLLHQQILPEPHFSDHVPGFGSFTKALAGAARPDALRMGAPLSLLQEPENLATGFDACGDCGGGGDLTAVKDTFDDCRLPMEQGAR